MYAAEYVRISFTDKCELMAPALKCSQTGEHVDEGGGMGCNITQVTEQ